MAWISRNSGCISEWKCAVSTAQGRDSPHLAVIKVVVKVHIPIQWVIGVAPALHVLTASWVVGRYWVKLWRS